MDACNGAVLVVILGVIGGLYLVKKMASHAGTPAGAAQIGGGIARWFGR